jgi:hypothetical protein
MSAHIYPPVLQAVSGRGYAGCLAGCFQGYRGEDMQNLAYELPRITIPRTPVNRAKDGEEALPPTWSSVAAGQALVVVSPIIVIDSYAIPDNVLTATSLVTYHWP